MIAFRKPVVIALAAAAVAIGVILLAAWRLLDAHVPSQGPPVAARTAPEGSAGSAPAAGSATLQAPAASSSAATPSAAVTSSAPAAQAERVASGDLRPVAPRPGAPVAESSQPQVSSAARIAAKPATPGQVPAPPTPGATPTGAAKPSFDIVRIEPSGDAVVAGRAPPRSRVALMVAGRSYGEAVADPSGQFVILPQTLPPGDHVLSLSADTGSTGAVSSEQTVAVAVPERGGGEVVAALVAPGKPTVVLSETPRQNAAAPAQGRVGRAGAGSNASGQDMLIRTVEAQQGGALFVSGVASPGAQLRLYLNDSFVASVGAGVDGRWSVKVERGMTPGAYRVRADQLGGDGKTLARVEAPFDYPVAAATARTAAAPIVARLEGEDQPQAPASSPLPPQASRSPSPVHSPGAPSQPVGQTSADGRVAGAASTSNHAVVEELRTAKVERGDSLWRISRTIYGEGVRYTQIYDANTSQIRDPDLIYPGQVFVVPKQQGVAP